MSKIISRSPKDLLPKPTKKWCPLCRCESNEAHLKGKKHLKNLKNASLRPIRKKPDSNDAESFELPWYLEYRPNLQRVFCVICDKPGADGHHEASERHLRAVKNFVTALDQAASKETACSNAFALGTTRFLQKVTDSSKALIEKWVVQNGESPESDSTASGKCGSLKGQNSELDECPVFPSIQPVPLNVVRKPSSQQRQYDATLDVSLGKRLWTDERPSPESWVWAYDEEGNAGFIWSPNLEVLDMLPEPNN